MTQQNHKHVKGARRAAQQEKEKHAPRGGTRAAQAEHTRIRRGYTGLPRGLKQSYDRTTT